MVVWEVEGPSLHPLTHSDRLGEYPHVNMQGISSVHRLPPRVREQMGELWPFGLLGETIAVGTYLHLLGRGRSADVERSGWVMAPQRMSYRTSASDLATANSTCWRLLVSRHSTSHHRKLARHTWCSP